MSALILLTLLAPGTAWGQGEASRDAPYCVARTGGTRWLPSPGGDGPQAVTYRATHAFGRGEENWLATPVGIRSRGARVAVFDIGYPRLLVLDDTLGRISAFGREGPGPKELKPLYLTFLPRYRDMNLLAFTDTTLAVYDSRAFKAFGHDGRHRWTATWITPFIVVSSAGVRWLAADPDAAGLIEAGTAPADPGPGGRLDVWRVTPEGSRKPLWSMDVPYMRRRRTSREARPFWVEEGGCQVAIDGARPWLFRFDPATGRLDSLALPELDVPAYGDLAGDRLTPVSPSGRRLGSGNDDRPLALLRWEGLALDPDGWAWLRRWAGDRDAPAVVDVVNIVTGERRVVRIHAFPVAFGAPGVFYSIEEDPNTEEALVIRYGMAR